MLNVKPKITIDLVEYLRDDLMVYTHYDTQTVSISRAAQIYELDKEEQYVHVEFTTNGKQDEIGVIWDIKRWKDSEELNTRRKVASDKARQQYYLDDDNIGKVCKALAKTTGIKDSELLRPLAVIIIKEKKFDSLPFLNLSELKVRIE